MNMEECKIQNLYALENTIAEPLLTRYTYPWEALKNIGDFIVEFAKRRLYCKRGKCVDF